MAHKVYSTAYVNGAEAETFLRQLHATSDPFSYVGISFIKDRKVEGYTVKAGDLWEASGFADVHWADLSSGWDAYVGVCSLRDAGARSGRGTSGNVIGMPGCWLDLDVDKVDVSAMLGVLPDPTLLVASGSGGYHPYWLFDEWAGADRSLVTGWFEWARSLMDNDLNNVSDLARMMRIPGTSNWKSGIPKSVRLEIADGPRYPVESIREKARIGNQIAAELRAIDQADRQWKLQPVGGLFADSEADWWAQQNVDWAALLEPKGWKLARVGINGERFWTRPGKDSGTSASTDWANSGVISVYSDSVETGLRGIEKPITKLKVLTELWFGGDEIKAIEWIQQQRSKGNGSE